MSASFVYMLAEVPSEARLAACRRGDASVPAFKVGKAEWAQAENPRQDPVAPVGRRLACAQSCNPRRLGVLASYGFAGAGDARAAESAVRERFFACHHVRPRGEWYRGITAGGVAWQEVAALLEGLGGRDVTSQAPSLARHGGYEEGSYERNRCGECFPLHVYVLRDDDGPHWRLLATSYPNRNYPRPALVASWYNTGNPRPVVLTHHFRADAPPAVANLKVRTLFATLHQRYGGNQQPWCIRPPAPWHALAWFPAASSFADEFTGLGRALLADTHRFGPAS